MRSETIFNATGKTVTGVFYLAILLGCLSIGVTTFNLINDKKEITEKEKTGTLGFEVMDFGKHAPAPAYKYSANHEAALQAVPGKYLLHVPYQSALGYVHYIVMLLQFAASLYIIWLLKKIFDNTSLKAPFTAQSGVFIRNIGLALIATDIIKLIQYLLFSKLAKPYFQDSNLQLVSNIGSNIWLGLIVLALSVIYKRGVEIYSENQLTI
ncbi:MAG: DUF2975 domain-containing protein [Chitinophagaceae bacterium]|nr:DUF2975 domain-containing protein [Chitinophagaceae bacterium]